MNEYNEISIDSKNDFVRPSVGAEVDTPGLSHGWRLEAPGHLGLPLMGVSIGRGLAHAASALGLGFSTWSGRFGVQPSLRLFETRAKPGGGEGK